MQPTPVRRRREPARLRTSGLRLLLVEAAVTALIVATGVLIAVLASAVIG